MSSSCAETITNIEKSKSYKFDCVIKILGNGLKALIISDKDAEKSSAALGVNIGSLTDQPDEMGLAHFCEHLLFMGTEKYPSEEEYGDYLSKNGGNSNAYTDLDKTVYYFDVDNEHFEGALDRFAQFFIAPKFNEGSVERELNAIDSEFSKEKTDDEWRICQLFKSELAKDSPFTNFATGNKQTLSHPDIRDRLLRMYNKYYSSEVMYLIVYSKLPLDNSIKLVEDYFSLVPKRENYVFPRFDKIKPYNKDILGYFYKIVPVKDEDKINFTWYLPFCENYYAKPLKFLSSLFGHEGPNTITSFLKRDNYITDLVSSEKNYEKTFSTFELEVTLTEKGFDNYKEVILLILKYIKAIQEKKINERYFNENKNITQLKFDFKDKMEPIDFTEKYAEYFMLYKPEDVFTGDTLFKEYNEELIKKYLNLLNLDNLNIYFESQSLEEECDLTEKWYGTKYSKEKITITKEEINSYKCDYNFDYPPENKFCPQNLDVLPTVENAPKYPEKIISEENCNVWFLQDNEFKLPRGRIKVEFKFVKNLCYNSDIKNEAICHLLKKIIKLEMNEIIYMASESEVNFKIKIHYNKLKILIEGFNDSLKRGLQEILTKIQNLKLDEEKYKEILDLQIKKYIKKTKNWFIRESDDVCFDFMKKLIMVPSINPDDITSFLSNEKITIEDLSTIKDKMFLETKSNWLIQGNLNKETALEIVQMVNELFKIDIKKKITKPFYDFRIVELKKNINYIYHFTNQNNEETDSSLISVYQCGNLEGEEKQYFNILFTYLSEKFYDTLRTKETLGYIVYLSHCIKYNVRHLVGIIQSSGQTPEFCSTRVNNFFKEKEKEIKEITDEIFNSHLQSRLTYATKKDRDLKEQFDRNWIQIKYGTLKFNINEESAEFLRKCTKEGFIKFYEKYFVNEVRKLDVEYVCEAHMEENEKKIKEKSTNHPNIRKRISYDKMSDFQYCNSLYPYIYSSNLNELNN